MILRTALAGAMLASFVAAASAQYPTKPVKVVVPAAPGGGTDIQARYMAARLSDRLGQQFVIENVAPAGGTSPRRRSRRRARTAIRC